MGVWMKVIVLPPSSVSLQLVRVYWPAVAPCCATLLGINIHSGGKWCFYSGEIILEGRTGCLFGTESAFFCCSFFFFHSRVIFHTLCSLSGNISRHIESHPHSHRHQSRDDEPRLCGQFITPTRPLWL